MWWYHAHLVTAQSMAKIEVVQFTIAVRSGLGFPYYCYCVFIVCDCVFCI